MNSPTTKRGLRLSNYPLVIQAALTGQGIALGWRHLVDDLLATGALVRPLETTLRTQRAYYLVMPTDQSPSKATTAFRDWILSEARAIAAIGPNMAKLS